MVSSGRRAGAEGGGGGGGGGPRHPATCPPPNSRPSAFWEGGAAVDLPPFPVASHRRPANADHLQQGGDTGRGRRRTVSVVHPLRPTCRGYVCARQMGRRGRERRTAVRTAGADRPPLPLPLLCLPHAHARRLVCPCRDGRPLLCARPLPPPFSRPMFCFLSVRSFLLLPLYSPDWIDGAYQPRRARQAQRRQASAAAAAAASPVSGAAGGGEGGGGEGDALPPLKPSVGEGGA